MIIENVKTYRLIHLESNQHPKNNMDLRKCIYIYIYIDHYIEFLVLTRCENVDIKGDKKNMDINRM